MSSPNEDLDLVSQLTVTTLLKSYIEDSLLTLIYLDLLCGSLVAL